ncbi:hypothetical protein AO269_00555 [Pseudomonas putida]|nr:hypothetical protein AO269_00555 [Pseudomonas putida]
MTHASKHLRHLTLRSLPLAIAAALLVPCSYAGADGLTAFDGAAAKPIIHSDRTVPVIDIVAPNQAGLSHNVYSEYNVGTEGVVLNNSVVAGHSELAGAMHANPQLGGTAASTILNEVVGHRFAHAAGWTTAPARHAGRQGRSARGQERGEQPGRQPCADSA